MSTTALEIIVTGDTSGAKTALQSVSAELGKTALAAQKTDSAIDAFTKTMSRFGPGAQSIAVLTGRVEALKAELVNVKDIDVLSKFNKQIQTTETEIARLSNVGKDGFDKIGNAIESTGNPLTKAYSGIRQLAYIIPGVGVAGIIGFATGPIIAYVEALLKTTDALSAAKNNLQNLNDVMKDANKNSGEQTADLKILYQAATDVNLSYKDRLAAVKALQTEFPDFFGNIKTETILNGGAKKSYDDLTISILQTSRAKAAKAKIDELESKRLDAEFQKQKIINATNNEANAARDRILSSSQSSGSSLTGGGTSGDVVTITRAEQLKVIEARKKAALALQDINIKSLSDQEDFLTKFAGLPSLAKIIEDEFQPKVPKEKIKKAVKDVGEEITTQVFALKRTLPAIEDIFKEAGRREHFDIPVLKLSPELQKQYDQWLKIQQALQATAEITNKVLAPAFDALFTTLLNGSGNAFQAFGDALLQILKQLAVTVLKAIALGAILAAITGKPFNIGTIVTQSIKGFAGGVKNFEGGVALVGEQGPELVTLPRGSNVIPNNQISSSGGGTSVFIPQITLRGQDLLIAFNRAQQTASRNG